MQYDHHFDYFLSSLSQKENKKDGINNFNVIQLNFPAEKQQAVLDP